MFKFFTLKELEVLRNALWTERRTAGLDDIGQRLLEQVVNEIISRWGRK